MHRLLDLYTSYKEVQSRMNSNDATSTDIATLAEVKTGLNEIYTNLSTESQQKTRALYMSMVKRLDSDIAELKEKFKTEEKTADASTSELGQLKHIDSVPHQIHYYLSNSLLCVSSLLPVALCPSEVTYPSGI